MNGELLQMMQLVVTANHYLKTGEFIDCVSYAHVGSLDFIVERRLFGFWKSNRTGLHQYRFVKFEKCRFMRVRGHC